MNMNISLTEELANFIKTKVSGGRYSSSSAVVREALRLMEEIERQDAEKLAYLRKAWQEGIDSGDAGEGGLCSSETRSSELAGVKSMKMSSLQAGDDPILKRLRAALDQVYGARAERVVLFGSRARGDAREDSDYDVAVFIENLDSFGQELDRLAYITTDILLDTGAVISAKPFPAGAYRERTAFMHDLRRDGIDL
jgi:putative addiction module CopG family antidote